MPLYYIAIRLMILPRKCHFGTGGQNVIYNEKNSCPILLDAHKHPFCKLLEQSFIPNKIFYLFDLNFMEIRMGCVQHKIIFLGNDR